MFCSCHTILLLGLDRKRNNKDLTSHLYQLKTNAFVCVSVWNAKANCQNLRYVNKSTEVKTQLNACIHKIKLITFNHIA